MALKVHVPAVKLESGSLSSKLSPQDVHAWSKHANYLLEDFEKVKEHLKTNDHYQLPRKVFGQLHASYSSLKARLDQLEQSNEEHASNNDHQGQLDCPKKRAGGNPVTTQQQTASESNSDDDVQSGSEGTNKEESEIRTKDQQDTVSGAHTDGNKDHTSTMVNTTIQVEDLSGDDDALSDGTGSTISSALGSEDSVAQNEECPDIAAFPLTILVGNPYLITRFNHMWSDDIVQECTDAIRAASLGVKGSPLTNRVISLGNGNIRVFARSETRLLALTSDKSWVDIFLENAKKAVKRNGVVAYINRNSKTRLNHKIEDAQMLEIFEANKPYLAALDEPRNITNIEWIRKIKTGPSKLLINFSSPVLANQVIKQGWRWAGEKHICERYVGEGEIRPCLNCLAYGHYEDQCSAKARCGKCSGNHRSLTCSSTTMMCPFCSIEHPEDLMCRKRWVEKRDYRLAIGRRSPFWCECKNPEPQNAHHKISANSPSSLTKGTSLQKPEVSSDAVSDSESLGVSDSGDTSRSETEREVRREEPPDEDSEESSNHDVELDVEHAVDDQVGHAPKGEVATASNEPRELLNSTSKIDSEREEIHDEGTNRGSMHSIALTREPEEQSEKLPNDKTLTFGLEQDAERKPNDSQRHFMHDAIAPLPNELISPLGTGKPPSLGLGPGSRDGYKANLQFASGMAKTPSLPAFDAPGIDLDSTPLADDTDAIIMQLERLKAIVLARKATRRGLAQQAAGEKRKALEPLDSHGGNSRTTTTKRVKQEDTIDDPVQAYIRENNCIPYPP